jgi:hypothetical protein
MSHTDILPHCLFSMIVYWVGVQSTQSMSKSQMDKTSSGRKGERALRAGRNVPRMFFWETYRKGTGKRGPHIF